MNIFHTLFPKLSLIAGLLFLCPFKWIFFKISVKNLMNLSWIYFTTQDNNLSPQ
nr:MAG TPA: hypothetical protein [Caudoviricetes sp.]